MSVQEEKLKAIADAIRAMEGSTELIPAGEFAARIRAITTGIDTSDATAGAGDILSGKTAYARGEKLIGTIPSVSGATITPGTSRKTAVASGRYTTGAVYVAGDTNLAAGNIKSGVSIFGISGAYNPLQNIKLYFAEKPPFERTADGVWLDAASFTGLSNFNNIVGIEILYGDSQDFVICFLGGSKVDSRFYGMKILPASSTAVVYATSFGIIYRNQSSRIEVEAPPNLTISSIVSVAVHIAP